MVKADSTNSVFWPAMSWNVQEVLLSGDYYHPVYLYLVPTQKMVTRRTKGLFSSKPYFQRDPSRSTGLLSFLYMLPGSNISYLLCVASANATTSNGTFLVFDDSTKYFAFLNELTDGIKESVFHKSIEIGTKNHTVCNLISLEVKEPSYFFFTSHTPAAITYFYNISSEVVYYNQSDYESEVYCAISADFACNVALPFGTQGYSLLAFINATADSDPPTTHVQADLKLSFHAMIFLAVFTFLFILLFAVASFSIAKNPPAGSTRLKTYIQ